ncbi:MAG: ATP-binding protein [Candidatus Marinimicrobia bacterium]|nr:ATP-binding protein [Candidatus Neomarinimicrobiota bacterium]MBL7109992.1 ATP-binding protein [Candidatus Neomarinimicrobiota bacterium]
MKIPSLRTQIIALALVFLVSSVLFFRFFFLESFINYQHTLNNEKTKQEMASLYQKFETKLTAVDSKQFKNSVEKMISDEKQQEIAGKMFQQEIALYSIFVFLFIFLFGAIFVAFSLYLITRPLQRLELATKMLSLGNLDVDVEENGLSPINPLIVSFNKMTAELRENREKLLEAEKEIIWRETAKATAHEIKNPLTPIRLSLERMQNKFGSDNFQMVFQDSISVISDEIENLRKLATEFSEFARFPQAKMDEFDLNCLISELIAPYREENEISVELADNLPKLHGDAMQIKQALTNLIQNSIQAESSKIGISAIFDNGVFYIQISDDGKGIAEEDLPKLFEPYFSKRKKGTGLGLAIVKRIIENHGGKIFVESEIGKSAKFKIEI